MARAKTLSKGTLIQRGKSRVWYLRTSEKGKVKFVRLLTPEGKKAANRTEAEALAVAWLARGQLGDRATQLRAVVTDLASVEAQAADLIEAARKRMAIAKVWQAFIDDQKRPKSGKSTLASYESSWHGRRKKAGATRSGFVGWLSKCHPEVLDIEAITPEIAAEYMCNVQQQGLSPGRWNGILHALRLIFKTVLSSHAPNKGNPFAGISRDIDKGSVVGHRALTREELAAILEHASGELQTLVVVGMATGLRLGDSCLLDWSEVDFLRGQIVVKPRKTIRATGKAVCLDIHPALSAALATIPPKLRHGPVMPGLAKEYNRNPSAVSNAVRCLFKQAGITDTSKPRTRGKRAAAVASFHSIRHFFVTELANQSTPLHEVRALVGHAGETMQAIYLHATPQRLAGEVSRLALPGDQAAPSDRQRLADLVGKLSDGAVVEVLAMVERLASLPSKK